MNEPIVATPLDPLFDAAKWFTARIAFAAGERPPNIALERTGATSLELDAPAAQRAS